MTEITDEELQALMYAAATLRARTRTFEQHRPDVGGWADAEHIAMMDAVNALDIQSTQSIDALIIRVIEDKVNAGGYS